MTLAAIWGWLEQAGAADNTAGAQQPATQIEGLFLASLTEEAIEPEGVWCHLPLSRLSILHGVH